MKEILLFLKQSYSPEKRAVDRVENIFPYFIARPISYVFSIFFIKVGLTANAVSKLSIVIALFASFFLAFSSDNVKLVGCLFCFLWIILDCVDGNLARYYRAHNEDRVTPNGEFFDAASGYYFNAFVFIGIGVGVFLSENFLPQGQSWLFIVLGSLTSVFSVLARLLYQKHYNVCKPFDSVIGSKGARGGFLAVVQNIIALSNFFQVLLPMSIVLGCLDVLLLLYFFLNFMMLVYISFKTKLVG